MAELLNQIEEYWSTRVEGYSEVNEKEIKDEIPTNCEVKQFVGIFLEKITT